jgi:hypothetical protein
MQLALPILVAAIALLLLALLLAFLWKRAGEKTSPEQMRQAFQQQRPLLQAAVLQQAARTGKPRGLRWTTCEFHPEVTLGQDQESGLVVGFVGVTVSFEAIAGGPMEDVEAVGNLRAGTAVFLYERGRWSTDGRVLFNLDPRDAMRRYEGRIGPIEKSAG